ncbi:MAG: nucleotide sugar dehydrogenase [Candidatus Midichloriaceae bacterium]|jgi:UDP-N-acetyl-D-glucosamine dehydrogenase|nr:nucleotide sugar dehydrogenase [Candidatus Midichloriaceae bacterium]
MEKLLNKIRNKTVVIGIIGLGYVGLPLAIRFAEEDFKVVGFDIDQYKINKIASGQSYIKHIPAESIISATKKGFECTSDFSKISEVDAIIICLPTPLNIYREPDLSYITETMDTMLPFLRAGQIMSLESTTYPGTTEEELLPRIESRGFKVGEDYFLVFSPEREDPANLSYNTQTIPKVVGGTTEACLRIGSELYKNAVDTVVEVSSTKVAEMTKLLENIHRAVNIGLVNEMKMVADKMGIDIYEVIEAASTKPFGFTPYYPGPGLGGHCIPIDPFYLTWKAREYKLHTRFIELAGEINTYMPTYVIEKVMLALNSIGKAISKANILVIGVAYKKNVDDLRESPSLEIIEELDHLGAAIQYHDTYIPFAPHTRKHHLNLNSIELTKENLKKFDVVLIATDHDNIDYDLIEKEASLIVDTRGRFRKASDKIIKA